MTRRTIAYLGIGYLLLSGAVWIVPLSSFGAIDSTYVYDVEPLDEDRTDYADADRLAFDRLSEPAKDGIERAIESEDGAYVTGDESALAPEFSFGTDAWSIGNGIYIVTYQGTDYELWTKNTTPAFTLESLLEGLFLLWLWVVGLLSLLAGATRQLRLGIGRLRRN